MDHRYLIKGCVVVCLLLCIIQRIITVVSHQSFGHKPAEMKGSPVLQQQFRIRYYR